MGKTQRIRKLKYKDQKMLINENKPRLRVNQLLALLKHLQFDEF